MIQGLMLHFAAANCHPSFFGFPTWYEYLKVDSTCAPSISGINDVWLIVAAGIEILLRVAALVAIGFVIYGGIQYVTSQAQPDKTAKAQGTIINALVGLIIAILAAVIINFIAGSIT